MISLFSDLASVAIPADEAVFATAGYSTLGVGAGTYVNDALSDAALATAFPIFCKADAAGRYFRLLPDEERIFADQAGAVGDGLADDGPAFQSAADYIDTVGGGTKILCAVGKVYGVARPILLNDNQTLHLNGSTLAMLAGFVTVSGMNCVVGADEKNNVAVVGPGLIDGNTVGLGEGESARKNGVMFKNCEGVTTDNFNLKNCTGYAHFAITCQDVTIARQVCMNSGYHFEQMGCRNVFLHDCRSEDGDGTITCSGWLHPVFADGFPCKRIRYSRFRGYGSCSSGALVQGSSLAGPQEDIHFEDCQFELLTAGAGMVVLGVNGHKNVTSTRCFFKSLGSALNLEQLSGGIFEGCVFSGALVTATFTASSIDFVDCTFVGSSQTSGTSFGVANGNNNLPSRVNVVRGKIDLSGSAGPKIPAGGTGLFLSPETILVGVSEYGLIDVPAASVLSPKVYFLDRTVDLTWTGHSQSVVLLVDASMQLPQGAQFFVRASSTGIKTIDAGPGVTLKPTTGTATRATISTNGTAVVQKSGVTASTWLISGDLV